jgi:hypothetical protein
MKSSGKTTFLFNLGGIKEIKSWTSRENYEEFEYKTKSGKTIRIEKGVDIGGGKNYMGDYKKIVSKNDVIFYFFNINEYLNDIEYYRNSNSRLSLIFPVLENKKTVLIATHADQSIFTKNQLREFTIERNIDKKYSKLFNENFFIENITNKEQFSDLIENLFK